MPNLKSGLGSRVGQLDDVVNFSAGRLDEAHELQLCNRAKEQGSEKEENGISSDPKWRRRAIQLNCKRAALFLSRLKRSSFSNLSTYAF